MYALILETEIAAPPEKCFALLRDPRLHNDKPARHEGEFGLGQIVSFPSRFVGIDTTLTVEVTRFEPPHLMVDEIREGIFREFQHRHEFRSIEAGTLMIDQVAWMLPFGPIGRVFNGIVEARLRSVIGTRNARLKGLAETD